MGSTGALEISVFQRLSAGKGTKPFRLAPWPKLKPLHVPLYAYNGSVKRTSIKQVIDALRQVCMAASLSRKQSGSIIGGREDQARHEGTRSICRSGGFTPPRGQINLPMR